MPPAHSPVTTRVSQWMSSAWIATALYAAAAVATTWPLAAGLTRFVPGDLGDPVFNCWILLWTAGTVVRVLHGDFSALGQYWNGNIFYPTRLTLAFSEHLTPQMLQMLPIYLATGNILLCYNLLLLSTMVLSGLGMYLFVRDLTDEPVAAFLAGLAFALAPYRLDQFSHIEVLSSQWMPFALYGLRRFFVSGRVRPLIGGATALVAQSLSCGYYLAYFPPFVLAYCLFEIGSRRKWRDLRMWRALVAAGGAVMVVTLAFVLVYFHVRHSSSLGIRDIGEIESYSADSNAYATASGSSVLWRDLIRAKPAAEGQGFQGLAIMAFACVGVGVGVMRAITRAKKSNASDAPWRQVAAGLLITVAVAISAVLMNILVTGRFLVVIGGVPLTYSNATMLMRELAIVIAALVVVSPTSRRIFRGVPGSVAAFFSCATVLAAWMSLGPRMHAAGLPIGDGLYDVFYRWVPGFNGLRVPSLFFMIVAFFLAILVGLGAAPLLSRWRRAGTVIIALAVVAMTAEAWMVPAPMDLRIDAPGYAPTPASLKIGRQLSPIYRSVRDMPAGVVVAEFPFGEPAYELQYVFYAGYHRKPILNGYSGFFPDSYYKLRSLLALVPANGDAAWDALIASGATNAIVHESAFLENRGHDVSDWLRQHGARDMTASGTDRLFQLR